MLYFYFILLACFSSGWYFYSYINFFIVFTHYFTISRETGEEGDFIQLKLVGNPSQYCHIKILKNNHFIYQYKDVKCDNLDICKVICKGDYLIKTESFQPHYFLEISSKNKKEIIKVEHRIL